MYGFESFFIAMYVCLFVLVAFIYMGGFFWASSTTDTCLNTYYMVKTELTTSGCMSYDFRD